MSRTPTRSAVQSRMRGRRACDEIGSGKATSGPSSRARRGTPRRKRSLRPCSRRQATSTSPTGATASAACGAAGQRLRLASNSRSSRRTWSGSPRPLPTTATREQTSSPAGFVAGRFFRRDAQLRQDGKRDLDTAERVALFKALEIAAEESPKDELSSRQTLDLGAQGAAVGAAMLAGNRSGLPASARIALAMLRGITLASSSVVRLLARSPAVGAALIFLLSALLVWGIVSPGVLLGALTPALAIVVLIGGTALLTIATGTFERSISTAKRIVAFSALLGVPLVFAVAARWPGADGFPGWLDAHVSDWAVTVSAALALAAACAAAVRGVLEVSLLAQTDGRAAGPRSRREKELQAENARLREALREHTRPRGGMQRASSRHRRPVLSTHASVSAAGSQRCSGECSVLRSRPFERYRCAGFAPSSTSTAPSSSWPSPYLRSGSPSTASAPTDHPQAARPAAAPASTGNMQLTNGGARSWSFSCSWSSCSRQRSWSSCCRVSSNGGCDESGPDETRRHGSLGAAGDSFSGRRRE